MEQHRVLIIGDSPFIDTGFGKLIRSLSEHIHSKGIEVRNIGFGDPRPSEQIKTYNKYTFPWTVYPSNGSIQQFALTRYYDILEEYNPTLIIVILDIFNATYFTSTPAYKVFFFHIEGEPMPELSTCTEKGKNLNWPETLANFDKIVFAGSWSKETAMKRFIMHYGKDHSYIEKAQTEFPVIPDGVDLDQFKPLYNKGELKKELWGLKESDFVIGFFSRMNTRKGLPYALEAFAKWPNRPDNVYFYIHTALNDPTGWNLKQMVADFGISDKVIVNENLKVGIGVDVTTLNKLYNACDFVSAPSLAEGFGLTTCVPPDTLVKTKRGYIPIEEVKECDWVFTSECIYRQVSAVHRTKYKGNMLRFRIDNGIWTTVMVNDKILAKKKNDARARMIPAYELAAGDHVSYMNCRQENDKQLFDVILKQKVYYTDNLTLLLRYREILTMNQGIKHRIVKSNDRLWKMRIYNEKMKRHDVQIKATIGNKNARGIKMVTEFPITAKRLCKYNGFVYNLSVDTTPNFLVNGSMIIHNCEALAAGTPVIVTDYSEMSQYDKGTVKLKPVAYYYDVMTNVKRAIPSVDDICDYYQKFYNGKMDYLKLEARDGVLRFDHKRINERWDELINAIPVRDASQITGISQIVAPVTPLATEPEVGVSIIITTKDKLELLEKCIKSIIQHTNGKFEIIINDTGSTRRETYNYLNEISKHPSIKIIYTKPTKFNFSKANNEAVKLSKYPVLLFLNNDTIVTHGWLCRMLKVLYQKDVGIVGSRLLFPNGTIQHAGVEIGNNGIANHIYVGRPATDPRVSLTREVAAVTGACFAIRKSTFDELGMFDERYIIEFQDIDLCLSARKQGYKVVYCADSIVYHVCSATRGLKQDIQDVINDRPYFITKWENDEVFVDRFSPPTCINPKNNKILAYWKKVGLK